MKYLTFFCWLSICAIIACSPPVTGPTEKPIPDFMIHSDNTPAGISVSFENRTIGEEVTYLWDFGDGQSTTQVAPSHTYLQAGNYQVVLTATNAIGTATISNPITILAPLPPAQCKLLSASIISATIFDTTWDDSPFVDSKYPDVYISVKDDLGVEYGKSAVESNLSNAELPIFFSTLFAIYNFPDNTKAYKVRVYDWGNNPDVLMKEFSFVPKDFPPLLGQYTSQVSLQDAEISLVINLQWAN